MINTDTLNHGYRSMFDTLRSDSCFCDASTSVRDCIQQAIAYAIPKGYKLNPTNIEMSASSADILPEITVTGHLVKEKETEPMNTPHSKEHFEFCKRAMESIRYRMPDPTRIEQHGSATVVHWDDGTYTAVNCAGGATEGNNIYAAYAAALAKKIYGSTSAVHKLVDRHNAERLDRIANEEKAKRMAEQAAAEKRNHDREVRRLAKQMQLQAEASALMFEKTLEEM